MKKAVAVLLLFLSAQAVVFAATPGTPEYAELSAYKKAQREQKEKEKANPSLKQKGFWAKEAERSGFAGTGAMFAGAVGSVVPLDKPGSRK